MKNTGIITNTQNIEFKCENPTNKDIDIIYVQNAIVLKTMKKLNRQKDNMELQRSRKLRLFIVIKIMYYY